MSEEEHDLGGHHGHTTSHHGISPTMWAFIALSIVVALMQGAFVVGSSGMGHVWPASDSTKVKLPEAAR